MIGDEAAGAPADAPNPILEAQRPVPTGNLIVTLAEDIGLAQAEEILGRATGQKTDIGVLADLRTADLPAGTTMFMEDVGIALIAPDQGAGPGAAIAALNGADGVVEARPEFYVFATAGPFTDTAARTWGIAATAAETSPFTGREIKVAVLDTGIDRTHHDFARRRIVVEDFVTPGGPAHDAHGHGTHCAGTVCGRPALAGIPRYGVATEVHLHIGKVLNDAGAGKEADILAGIAWAIRHKCEVISMSLGRTVRPGEGPNRLYERLGRRALRNGTLIVAAAGNDSARAAGFIAPVSVPANSPSIMAVAAVDQALAIAYFSNGGINPAGGNVDIAGPGVNVFSAAPMPRGYRTFGGTSMACPHVAGVAALWAQSDATLRGQSLWDALVKNALPLPHPARDVGAGLVQAPQTPSRIV